VATIAALCALLAAAVPSHAADGDLLRSFGGDGRVVTDLDDGSIDRVGAAALTQAGLVLAGSSTKPPQGVRLALAAYLADGSLNPRFGNRGILLSDAEGGFAVESMASDSYGDIILAGAHPDGEPSGDVAVAKLRGDGGFEPLFGGDGIVALPLHLDVAAVRPGFNGGVVLAGTSGSGDGTETIVVQLNRDGSFDASFGGGDGIVTLDLSPGGPEVAADMIVDGLRRVVVFGGAWLPLRGTSRNMPSFSLARLAKDGTPAPSLAGDGTRFVGFGRPRGGFATAGAVDVKSRSMLAGMARPDVAVAAVRENGSLDPEFGNRGRVRLRVREGYRPTDVAVDRRARTIVTLGAGTPANSREGDFVAVRLRRVGRPDPRFSRDGRVSTGFGRLLASAEVGIINFTDALFLAGIVKRPRDRDSDFAAAMYRFAY
jgi:uncharacterized delta-60 repeat protein